MIVPIWTLCVTYSKQVEECLQKIAQMLHVTLSSDIWTSKLTQSYWFSKPVVFNNDQKVEDIA